MQIEIVFLQSAVWVVNLVKVMDRIVKVYTMKAIYIIILYYKAIFIRQVSSQIILHAIFVQ